MNGNSTGKMGRDAAMGYEWAEGVNQITTRLFAPPIIKIVKTAINGTTPAGDPIIDSQAQQICAEAIDKIGGVISDMCIQINSLITAGIRAREIDGIPITS